MTTKWSSPTSVIVSQLTRIAASATAAPTSSGARICANIAVRINRNANSNIGDTEAEENTFRPRHRMEPLRAASVSAVFNVPFGSTAALLLSIYMLTAASDRIGDFLYGDGTCLLVDIGMHFPRICGCFVPGRARPV